MKLYYIRKSSILQVSQAAFWIKYCHFSVLNVGEYVRENFLHISARMLGVLATHVSVMVSATFSRC